MCPLCPPVPTVLYCANCCDLKVWPCYESKTQKMPFYYFQGPISAQHITSYMQFCIMHHFFAKEQTTYQKIFSEACVIKFIYSEKATIFCEIFPLLLTTVHTVKSKGKILQNFVAFSEYMNFTENDSVMHIFPDKNKCKTSKVPC